MDAIVFVAISTGILAVVGALSALFGADSRPSVEDTHQAHDAVRN
jgi:hypothetical protein